MVNWFDVDWSLTPESNVRLNPLHIDFSKSDLTLVSPRDAAIAAVRKIVSEYPAPYTLLASGGADSQAMIWAWLISGIKFKVVHYSYVGELNKFDTITLIDFCVANCIEFEIKYFDALAFIRSSELIDYAKEFDCASPQINSYIKFVQNHKDETVIMSGNYIQHEKCGINYTIYGLERFARQEKKNFVPFFFLSTPELAYSFWESEREFYQPAYPYSTSLEYNAKIYSYGKAGCPIVPQSGKMSGFERMKEIVDPERVPYMSRIKYAAMPSRRTFDILYRYTLFDHIQPYTDKVVITHHPSIKD